ncbi:hypothetical protein Y032_0065g3645 [Ancylostoma ceylanicum]|nr:hypothetical protein Y032_0065g3645 [Ancylostoma ceylanicum]
MSTNEKPTLISRYPAYTIDDSGRFFITRPQVKHSNGKVGEKKTIKDLVPRTLYYSHPKSVAPPNPDLPLPIRNEAYFINRRVFGIH